MNKLLRVDAISVTFEASTNFFSRSKSVIRAVNEVSFAIKAGETFGLVGESGSGKSTLARTILQLEKPSEGKMYLEGKNIADYSKQERIVFRKQVQAVLQDPFSSLNHRHATKTIIGDAITQHFGIRPGEERDRQVAKLLATVGLPKSYLHRYPRELSGGQRQRISIARALAVEPDLIVADEVTSALDSSVRGQVINLLKEIQAEKGLAFLFISHDLEVVRYISDTIGVMYLGYLVETGNTEQLNQAPTHPYTEMLLASLPVPNPSIQAKRKIDRRRFVIDSEPPSPANLPEGCPFANRCPVAMNICFQKMPLATPTLHGGTVRCHLHTSGPKLGGESIVEFTRKIKDEVNK